MIINTHKISHPFIGKGKKIESMVRKAIFDFSLLCEVKSLAVALSGGKDSICLLFMLKAILGNGFKKVKLSAIHIDGDFSCGASFEKKFLKNLCDEIDVKIYFKEQKNTLKNFNCYTCSRQRRKLIFDIAKENDIDTIAFGHHRDDNIETLLLNLFHIGDFEAMQPKIKFQKFDKTIIRPLIYVSEKDIITFAKQNEILKTFCKCPMGQKSKRNDVKKIILNIENNFPNIKSNLSKASFLYGSKKALLGK
ncbi:MAG: tRNA 2-thiocytidine biosynthesis protein TtcA [Candidatus Anoxychlamydiales bacterium]|nr:tRNA 2-thiocytidine biosynthesis protein TtcA [Candidatus Anoxychlamydiales bacterium]NGX41399.1 tRNA 2-thiocytidine biosynthesis protein TtcA [Candidatus Anoxychlamydiales bacterium]HEU63892.1 tRNA lysidine(34) synthetase TilS [Chlamydiota bacterium]